MFYLDSAHPDDAREASELGFVAGVTTNPSLMAKVGGEPLAVLAEVLAAFPGPVFYQPAPSEVDAAEEQARRAFACSPGQVTIKLPARGDFARLAARLTAAEVPCALTAVYSPAQALVARAAGCRWVIPYFDRARRLVPEVDSVVAELAAALGREPGAPRILAASVKSPEQAVRVLADGAAAASMPLAVLRELPEHDLSLAAIREFEEAAAGMPGE